MLDFLSKLIFLLRKPKAVVFTSGDREMITQTIFQILGQKLNSRKNEILILEMGKKENLELIKKLSKKSYLILNNDDESTGEIMNLGPAQVLTIGINRNADFFASDIKQNRGLNFKINHKGNIVPFWLENASREEEIYVALAVTAVATIFGLNLVEISQNLKKLAK